MQALEEGLYYWDTASAYTSADGKQEKQKVTTALTPFFQDRDLPWMNTDYCDRY